MKPIFFVLISLAVLTLSAWSNKPEGIRNSDEKKNVITQPGPRRYKMKDIENLPAQTRRNKLTWVQKTERFVVMVGSLGLLFFVPGSHFSYQFHATNGHGKAHLTHTKK